MVGEFEGLEAERGGSDARGEHEGRRGRVDVEVEVLDLVEGEVGMESRVGSGRVLEEKRYKGPRASERNFLY